MRFGLSDHRRQRRIAAKPKNNAISKPNIHSAKAATLGGVLGLGGVLVIYGLLGATPWWWLIAAVVFFVVGIALAALFPVLIVPLFYTLKELGVVLCRWAGDETMALEP